MPNPSCPRSILGQMDAAKAEMLDRRSRILIVDDSLVARKIVRRVLYGLGYDVVDEAIDGTDALAKLDKRHYALVVSDWDMAPMNGLDLLTAMRRSPRWARTPFIMVTGMSQVRFADAARDFGATHYIAKPFTADAFAARLAAFSEARVG